MEKNVHLHTKYTVVNNFSSEGMTRHHSRNRIYFTGICIPRQIPETKKGGNQMKTDRFRGCDTTKLMYRIIIIIITEI